MKKKKNKKNKKQKMGYMYKVTAPGLEPKALDLLRKEFKKSIKNPNRVMVTNFAFNVEMVPVI